MPHILCLLRHGESQWNKENRFTGWTDVDLTEEGRRQAVKAGRLLRAHNFTFDIAYTSVLRRAIRTLWHALDEMELLYLPDTKTWRLNERHYGALQGLNKAETAAKHGADQVKIWRRSYSVPPPELDLNDPRHPRQDERYNVLTDPADLPAAESLKDTVARCMPFWDETIAPAVTSGKRVVIAAHGNSLRALCKYLDDIPDDAIVGLEIPTGLPLIYELDNNLKPIRHYYLGEELGQAPARIALVTGISDSAQDLRPWLQRFVAAGITLPGDVMVWDASLELAAWPTAAQRHSGSKNTAAGVMDSAPGAPVDVAAMDVDAPAPPEDSQAAMDSKGNTKLIGQDAEALFSRLVQKSLKLEDLLQFQYIIVSSSTYHAKGRQAPGDASNGSLSQGSGTGSCVSALSGAATAESTGPMATPGVQQQQAPYAVGVSAVEADVAVPPPGVTVPPCSTSGARGTTHEALRLLASHIDPARHVVVAFVEKFKQVDVIEEAVGRNQKVLAVLGRPHEERLPSAEEPAAAAAVADFGDSTHPGAKQRKPVVEVLPAGAATEDDAKVLGLMFECAGWRALVSGHAATDTVRAY